MPLSAPAMPRERTAREYFVEVVSCVGENVVKRLGPLTESRADRVDAGLNINLDRENFYTRIVAEEPEQ